MKKKVLGVKIDDVSIDEAVGVVEKWLKGRGKHYITTPNPEIVMMSQEDLELKKILNDSDLAIPDGNGLKLGTDIICNTPGIDLMERLIKIASEKGFTTALLGGRDHVAEKCAERLRKKYRGLKVVFASSGGNIDSEGNSIEYSGERSIPYTDLLFVAFGPPKQEKWIAKNLDRLNVRVAMGVGGAFDVLSGRMPRVPEWMRSLGLEWLFRLFIQPWRLKRQLKLLKYIWLLKKDK